MTEAEQAELYTRSMHGMSLEEAKALMNVPHLREKEAGYMGKVDWSSRHADALEDHMALEVLYTYDEGEKDARRKAYKERGAMLMRGVDDRDYFPLSSAPEVAIQGYAAWDPDWAVLFERMAKADRLAAQRPLIHNGRKHRK